jgi:hypothetical protein
VASRILAYGSYEVNEALEAVRRSAEHPPPAFAEAIDRLLGQIRLELRHQRDEGRLDATTRWQG